MQTLAVVVLQVVSLSTPRQCCGRRQVTMGRTEIPKLPVVFARPELLLLRKAVGMHQCFGYCEKAPLKFARFFLINSIANSSLTLYSMAPHYYT